jgi:hypothetical protein
MTQPGNRLPGWHDNAGAEIAGDGVHTALGITFLVGLAIAGIASFNKEKQAERQRTANANRYADPVTRDRILEKKIWQGMTEQQLVDSWGQPLGRSRRVLKTKVKETYTYGSRRYGSKVHLENGRVVGWNQPR